MTRDHILITMRDVQDLRQRTWSLSSLRTLVGIGKTNLESALCCGSPRRQRSTHAVHPVHSLGKRQIPYNGLCQVHGICWHPCPITSPASSPIALVNPLLAAPQHEGPCSSLIASGMCPHKVPWHWLFPLPETPFLQIAQDQLPHLLQIFTQKSLYS